MTLANTPQPPLVQTSDVTRVFHAPRRRFFQPRLHVEAVRGISLTVHEGESVAIVGESGSGKSTLLKLILGLDSPTSGTVTYRGKSVTDDADRRKLWLRRETGVVFQDPRTSLDPRMTVQQIVGEPLEALDISGNHRAMVIEMLDRVSLPEQSLSRYPHEFSGGQRQRIALARALIHNPRFLVGDEPVSALDILVRAQILELLEALRADLNLTLLTVTHDFGVVGALADRVVVMRSGQIVESGDTQQILFAPKHPYTQQLIAAIPELP